jgi:hypothetical protein
MEALKTNSSLIYITTISLISLIYGRSIAMFFISQSKHIGTAVQRQNICVPF